MCHCHAKVDFLSSSAFPQGNGLFCLYSHTNFNVVSTALLLSHSMLSQQLLSRYTWCQLHLWVWSVASSHRLSVGPGCKCEALHCSARTCVPTQLFHDKHGFLGCYSKNIKSKAQVRFSLHHLFQGASDLYCDSLWEDVSCSCRESECNSEGPHLEQARSLGHILTFTPGSHQINSIYCSRFSSGPLQVLSHLSSQPDMAYLGSSVSTVAHYHIKWDSERILCHSLWPD